MTNFIYFQVRAAIQGNYKHERLQGRGDEYANQIVQTAYEQLLKTGELLISKFEAKAGRTIKFVLDGDVLIESE